MLYGRETFVARMPDAGMAPGILERDYLYVDPDEPVRAGGIVAIRDPRTGRATARRYDMKDGRRVVRALAPGWPDYVLDSGNETMILGAVVFVGRRP